MIGPMSNRGLDDDGTIAREGALDRVPLAFGPVVEAARARITGTFGPARLHSAYLYGSIPRGTARPGRSDVDLVLALHHEPDAADRADARMLETALDDTFSEVNGVGILLFSVRTLLSDLERYDLGFFVACLCTPLLGPDAGQMRVADVTGQDRSADPAILAMLIDDLGPWLAAEYTAVHGEKTPRP